MLIIDLVTSIATLIWYILFTASNDDKAVQSDAFLLKKRLLCYARFLNILRFSLWSFIRPLLNSVYVLIWNFHVNDRCRPRITILQWLEKFSSETIFLTNGADNWCTDYWQKLLHFHSVRVEFSQNQIIRAEVNGQCWPHNAIEFAIYHPPWLIFSAKQMK